MWMAKCYHNCIQLPSDSSSFKIDNIIADYRITYNTCISICGCTLRSISTEPMDIVSIAWFSYICVCAVLLIIIIHCAPLLHVCHLFYYGFGYINFLSLYNHFVVMPFINVIGIM